MIYQWWCPQNLLCVSSDIIVLILAIFQCRTPTLLFHFLFTFKIDGNIYMLLNLLNFLQLIMLFCKCLITLCNVFFFYATFPLLPVKLMHFPYQGEKQCNFLLCFLYNINVSIDRCVWSTFIYMQYAILTLCTTCCLCAHLLLLYQSVFLYARTLSIIIISLTTRLSLHYGSLANPASN